MLAIRESKTNCEGLFPEAGDNSEHLMIQLRHTRYNSLYGQGVTDNFSPPQDNSKENSLSPDGLWKLSSQVINKVYVIEGCGRKSVIVG